MDANAPSRAPQPIWTHARAYAFALVPLVALGELIAHGAIVTRVPSPAEWIAARAFIAHERRAGDLVESAPWWTSPLSRMYFADLIPLRDAARADATSYRRALVATIRDGHHPDFDGWREERAQQFGRVTVRVLANPHPATVRYDFVEHLRPPDAHVVRADRGGDHACEFQRGMRTDGGGLGQGMLAGPERYLCGDAWNYVGRSIGEDEDHRGRLCVWSHPVVDAPMRTVFAHVPMGTMLRGHTLVAYEADRGGDHYETGAPITLTVHVGSRDVGSTVHFDGDGWKLFEFDTRLEAGAHHEVTFEVTVPSGGNRHFCFQADTR